MISLWLLLLFAAVTYPLAAVVAPVALPTLPYPLVQDTWAGFSPNQRRYVVVGLSFFAYPVCLLLSELIGAISIPATLLLLTWGSLQRYATTRTAITWVFAQYAPAFSEVHDRLSNTIVALGSSAPEGGSGAVASVASITAPASSVPQ